MGEMADYYLDQVLDDEDARLEWRLGLMDPVEAYERGLVDEQGYEYGPGYQKPKQCRFCKQSGLYWGKLNGNWRLFDGEHPHSCQAYIP